MSENKKGKRVGISRREFLKDAGFIASGVAIGSTVLWPGVGETKTVTNNVTQTNTVTTTSTESKFVCPIDGMEFDTLAALQTHFTAEHPTEEMPEKMTKLTINGLTYELRVEPNWTLAFVLREKLGFTGVKRGCNEGACGACTILVDGTPMLSCTMLAIECENRSIETIEGLAPDAITLHPIQQAFLENHGMQCGYCTPGIILTTKALLSRIPNPNEQEVRKALAGNICKCGDYQQILASVLAAATK